MAIRSTKRKSKSRRKATRGPGAGCLIWLVLFSITLVLFIAFWGRIRATLESTRFIEAMQRERPAVQAPVPVIPGQSGDGSAEPGSTQETPRPQTPSPQTPTPPPEQTPSTEPSPAPSQPSTPTALPGPQEAMEQLRQTRVASLYFVKVDDGGIIDRRQVKRTIASSDSPLTDAIQALLRGPSPDELNQSLITLVPSGTRLLSAQVRGSTAYLNFNEAFLYNTYGSEGYAGQLKQIIFTATEFSTVRDVFILIEGQPRDYLDTVYIGHPLTRTSF